MVTINNINSRLKSIDSTCVKNYHTLEEEK
jgi:hypothetical protein